MPKTTATTRLAAAVVAVFISFATVALAAEYAYPEAKAVQLASAQR